MPDIGPVWESGERGNIPKNDRTAREHLWPQEDIEALVERIVAEGPKALSNPDTANEIIEQANFATYFGGTKYYQQRIRQWKVALGDAEAVPSDEEFGDYFDRARKAEVINMCINLRSVASAVPVQQLLDKESISAATVIDPEEELNLGEEPLSEGEPLTFLRNIKELYAFYPQIYRLSDSEPPHETLRKFRQIFERYLLRGTYRERFAEFLNGLHNWLYLTELGEMRFGGALSPVGSIGNIGGDLSWQKVRALKSFLKRIQDPEVYLQEIDTILGDDSDKDQQPTWVPYQE